MLGLTALTAGLVGPRDAAQPLLTLLDGPARVELSGATAANWVAKTANLLVDGEGGPQRVGVVPHLHWQAVCALLGAVTSGARVVVAGAADGLGDVDLALVPPAEAAAALATGADVLVLSDHPMGLALGDVPAGAGDYAREVLAHADAWTGARPSRADVTVGSAPLGDLPGLGLGVDDRVLVAADPGTPDGLRLLLAVLRAGAAAVLAPSPGTLDLPRVAELERLTASAGADLPGLRRLG